MRAYEFITERKKRRRRNKYFGGYWYPGYGYYGSGAYGGESGDSGGGDGGGGESVTEIDRRGFLGALGAGAMAAAGVPVQAKTDVGPPILSGNYEAEELLHKTARAAGIRGVELAQFLAQCFHESAGFKRMKEFASGAEYEGRRDLGNIYKGDGVRYKGRGFIQITGRDNYRRAGQALNLPLEDKPELASRPDVAAKIAIWYWKTRVKPNVTNFNDTRAVTRWINPKMHGLEQRHENFTDYKKVFAVTRTR